MIICRMVRKAVSLRCPFGDQARAADSGPALSWRFGLAVSLADIKVGSAVTMSGVHPMGQALHRADQPPLRGGSSTWTSKKASNWQRPRAAPGRQNSGGNDMLDSEIESAQRKVKTDAYQMSIGEIVNMYKDDELVINPDFQRLFRWEVGQKAKLIESVLLGIPIPSIFVFETDDGKWELIDGLQRISTILEFMGLLKDPENRREMPPSSLVGTKYLPSLNNVVWQKAEHVKMGSCTCRQV
jgi:hypothetical protein